MGLWARGKVLAGAPADAWRPCGCGSPRCVSLVARGPRLPREAHPAGGPVLGLRDPRRGVRDSARRSLPAARGDRARNPVRSHLQLAARSPRPSAVYTRAPVLSQSTPARPFPGRAARVLPEPRRGETQGLSRVSRGRSCAPGPAGRGRRRAAEGSRIASCARAKPREFARISDLPRKWFRPFRFSDAPQAAGSPGGSDWVFVRNNDRVYSFGGRDRGCQDGRVV